MNSSEPASFLTVCRHPNQAVHPGHHHCLILPEPFHCSRMSFVLKGSSSEARAAFSGHIPLVSLSLEPPASSEASSSLGSGYTTWLKQCCWCHHMPLGARLAVCECSPGQLHWGGVLHVRLSPFPWVNIWRRYFETMPIPSFGSNFQPIHLFVLIRTHGFLFYSVDYSCSCIFFFFLFLSSFLFFLLVLSFLFFLSFFRATPTAYGSFQARG